MTNLEQHFLPFRNQIIGIEQHFVTEHGEEKPLIYADWTASGRCYFPIEEKLQKSFLPFVANTHTEINHTGKTMTQAYHEAREIIRKHVNANRDDLLFCAYSGMTGLMNKLQRIMGFRVHENYTELIRKTVDDVPVVFITHMEHHSNQTSWLETIAEVVIVPPDEEGLVSVAHFQEKIEVYKNRKLKIASITACSNVTGIQTPFYEIAKLMHEYNGLCFVDFAAAAPYIHINMHPNNEKEHLDAIFISPHKFLGGPGSSGVMIVNKKLHNTAIPDVSGGGTVDWTNPWGQHKYLDDIEQREDGGTPPFLQTIRTALCFQLKEIMGVENIFLREIEINTIVWNELENTPNLHILANSQKHRLSIFSFYIDDLHFNVGVKLLNDKFGIQTRGGCSCAGTYGHFLLHVNQLQSEQITNRINVGDYSEKPGWIRMSLHPTSSNEEVYYICNAIKLLAQNHKTWALEYNVDDQLNVLSCKARNVNVNRENNIKQMFDIV